jgi:hypothetical protein
MVSLSVDDSDHFARARIDHVDPVAVHRISITSHGRIFDVGRHLVNLDVGRNLRSNAYAARLVVGIGRHQVVKRLW